MFLIPKTKQYTFIEQMSMFYNKQLHSYNILCLRGAVYEMHKRCRK